MQYRTALTQFDLQVDRIFPTKFRVNCPFDYEQKFKIHFLNGSYGGHCGFPIRTILASFDLRRLDIFVTFLPSREKQINSLLLVSVGDTDK